MKSKVFAFDFDGVIGLHEGVFKGVHHENDINPEVKKAIHELKRLGHIIVIHSLRPSSFLRKYCKKHDIPFDYINKTPFISDGNKGKPFATVYVDDKAYCYRGQRAKKLVTDLLHFKPYHVATAEEAARVPKKRTKKK